MVTSGRKTKALANVYSDRKGTPYDRYNRYGRVLARGNAPFA
jgi:hypothetical protein